MKVRKEIGDKKGTAEAFNNLANVYYEQGNYGRSAKMLEKSLEIMLEIGFQVGIAGTYNNLGTIYQDLGRYQEALDVHEKGLTIREEIGDMPGVAMSLGNLGSVDFDLGNFSKAKERLEKSLELQKEMRLRVFEPEAYAYLSLVLLELGQHVPARQTARKALSVATEMNQKANQGIAKRILGVLEIKQINSNGDTSIDKKTGNRIELQLTESLKIFEELKMEHEIGRSCLELAQLYHLKGDSGEAQKHIFRAEEIFKKLGAMGDLDKANNLEIK